MKLKLQCKTKESLTNNFKFIMNMACVMVQMGYIPSIRDIAKPEVTGRYWFIDETGKRIDLAACFNDYWCDIIEQNDKEFFIIFEFSCRYDLDNSKKKALTDAVLAFVSICVTKID